MHPPGGDGQTWETAFDDLRDAVALAEQMGGGGQQFRILIGGGDYLGDAAGPLTLDVTVNQLNLIGGFAGLDPLWKGNRDVNNPLAFPSTLRGDGVSPILEVIDSGPSLDNGLISAIDMTSSLVRGLELTGLAFVDDQAISVRANETTQVVVTDCRFENGSTAGDGGAIDAFPASLLVRDSAFMQNSAVGDGGAIAHVGRELVLLRNTFEQNTGENGGAVWTDASFFGMRENTFSTNIASAAGGAVADRSDRFQLRSNRRLHQANSFEGNRALDGGAVSSSGGTNFVECSFTMNQAGDFPGPTASRGGGAVEIRGTASDWSGVVFQGCTLHDNTTFGDGGAIYRSDFGHAVHIRDTVFLRNESVFGEGGAMWLGMMKNDDDLIVGSEFIENSAIFDGGALYAHGNGRVESSTFARNFTIRSGGSIFGLGIGSELSFRENRALIDGHAIYLAREIVDCVLELNGPFSDTPELFTTAAVVLRGDTRIVRSLVRSEAANERYAIRVHSGATGVIISDSQLEGGLLLEIGTDVEIWASTLIDADSSTFATMQLEPFAVAVVESSVITGGVPIETREASALFLVQSAVPGGLDLDAIADDSLMLAGPLIEADPLFVDPDGPDGDPATFADNDYRLAANSPLIDAGFGFGIEPGRRDLDGNPRVRDDLGRVGTFVGSDPIDIGAYEFQGTSCPADVNRDGRITESDFFAWVTAFLAEDLAADVNTDGEVTDSDYFAWLSAFGSDCP